MKAQGWLAGVGSNAVATTVIRDITQTLLRALLGDRRRHVRAGCSRFVGHVGQDDSAVPADAPQQLERNAEADLDSRAGDEGEAAAQVGALLALRPVERGALRAELRVEGVQLAEPRLARVARGRSVALLELGGRRAGPHRLAVPTGPPVTAGQLVERRG